MIIDYHLLATSVACCCALLAGHWLTDGHLGREKCKNIGRAEKSSTLVQIPQTFSTVQSMVSAMCKLVAFAYSEKVTLEQMVR